ncbi:thioredoxin family protein [Tautonia sociabilis]|uniref:Thioredoxin family protein n=1 Tax=Tautonia sociabilis TaxID=2080755 RepID=A0A432MKM1_9BACT|nr:thioredoxin family protein [Tautonia sociabilis]RUL87973.1 thioredoxin family protein [Tautonia sociabilis]
MGRFARAISWGMAVSAVLACASTVEATASEVAWRADYATALKEAGRSGRPVVIVVESEGCGWCRRLERTTLLDPQVVGVLNGATVPLKIDASDLGHEALVATLGAEGVPAIVVVAPPGRIVARRVGYLDRVGFLGFIRPFVAGRPR